MKPLRVRAFMDGRPGHEKQTQGVVAALEQLTPTVTTYDKLPPSTFMRGLKNWLIYFSTLGLRLLPPEGKDRVDLIVGTGTATHIPMLRLKSRSQAKVVTCMTPEPLLSSKIDLCLVPHHDQPPQRTNIFVTIGPPGLPPRKRQDDARQVLILVGGRDEKSHTWQTDVLVSQIETLIRRATDCLWTITSSPRTPDECERRLQVVADEHPQVTFFRAKDTAPGWVEEAYARHAGAWVTADSISMIYEALTAGCRVGILPVKWKSAHNKFQRSIDFLVRQQLVLTYERWLNDAAEVPQPAVLDEAARCAKEILRRWWPERLR